MFIKHSYKHILNSVFVTCRKRFYNHSGGLYLSFETLWDDEILNISSSNTNTGLVRLLGVTGLLGNFQVK